MEFLRRLLRKKPTEHTAPAAPIAGRVSVAEARVRLSSSDALVVCAYEDEEVCKKVRLAGALTFNELKAMAASLSTARELIFYCG
jgi:predicted peroxiredoxin